MDLKVYLIVVALVAECINVPLNDEEDDFDLSLEKRDARRHRKGSRVQGISVLESDDPHNSQYDPSDHEGSGEDSSGHQGAMEKLLERFYQFMFRVDRRLATVENQLMAHSNQFTQLYDKFKRAEKKEMTKPGTKNSCILS